MEMNLTVTVICYTYLFKYLKIRQMQKSQISVTVTKGVKTGKNDSNRGLKKGDLTFPRGDLTFLEPVLSQNPLEFEEEKRPQNCHFCMYMRKIPFIFVLNHLLEMLNH